MSFIDTYMDRINKGKNLLTKIWSPLQKNLIILVKNNPVTYLPSTKPTKTWDTAWKEIASKLCQPSEKCKQLWTKIKFGYAKILNLINTGKISKEVAMSHPKTGRFFDGLLSFVNPLVSQITDENIPFRIHKSINDIFGLKTKKPHVLSKQKTSQFVTHAQVKALLLQRQLKGDSDVDSTDMEYLQSVVDSAVKRKLGELLPINNDLSDPSNEIVNNDDGSAINFMMPNKNLQTVPKINDNNTLIPSKNIINKDEENTTKRIKLGLESELIIEDDIKMEDEDDIKIENEDDVNDKNLTLDKNVNNISDGNNDLENNLPSTQIIIMPVVDDTSKYTLTVLKNDVTVSEGNIENTMVNNGPPISDEYIRKFCKELGDVMSLELTICKQKTLQSRLNELLKSTFLKEED